MRLKLNSTTSERLFADKPTFVIDDSYVWKDRLRRERASLKAKMRRAQTNEDLLETAFVGVEVFVFLVGYVTRKLIEAKKISDELEAASMGVDSFPRQEPDYKLDYLNAHHIDRAYNLQQPQKKRLRVGQLCNLIIHSFVFMPSTDDDGKTCVGFFVNSDRTKETELLFIDWDDFNVLVDEVISDDIVSSQFDRRADSLTKSRVGPGDPQPVIRLNV